MRTALFFGSFNPIHNGHIAIAGYIVEHASIDDLWFVVSPQNPLKESQVLAPEEHRLEMVRLALREFPKLSVCDVEFQMPRPSYTIDTLNYLKNKYPDREFVVIMGSDSIESIGLWKNYIELINNNRIIVYPRLGTNLDTIKEKYSIEIVQAPIIELSSTFIRNSLFEGKDVSYFIPKVACQYIKQNRLYI